MTLHQIQYAATAGQCGSLNGAARQLFVSQSAISLAIKELESELGVALFQRSRVGLTPTPEGEAFLRKAREVLGAVAELSRAARPTPAAVTRLRVASAQSGAAPVALSGLLAQLESVSTPFHIHYKMDTTAAVIDAVEEGRADAGFVYATAYQWRVWPGILAQRGLGARALWQGPLYFILSEADPLAARAGLAFSDLDAYTFIFSGDDGLDRFSNLFDYSAEGFNLLAHPRYVDAQDSAALSLLLRRPGRFSIGHWPWEGAAPPGLRYVPLEPAQRVHLVAVLPEDKPPSAALESLLSRLARPEPGDA
jgi:DNA-binding transcriptional LysR family regulator